MKRTRSGRLPETSHRNNDPDETMEVVDDYQVFLSFRGPDSRQGLADVLYNDMITTGIRVFRDDDEVAVGDQIGNILQAVENSEICVPIFSKTFAASAWCLREVERMVELEKTIMPIFYTATPDDVKLRTELFKEDLKERQEKHGREQVEKWEKALKDVARIKGREVNSFGFAEFSKLFVRDLLNKLKVKKKYVLDRLVKREDQEARVMKLLDIDSTDTVRLIGIHGMGGLGKTTLAKVIFNQLSTRFDCCSFLENIQEALRRNSLESLIKQLLEDLEPKLKHFPVINSIKVLRENFRKRRVLIVLDDVSQRKQIEMIVGMSGWFGSGSRIIVTTRDKRVLTRESWAFEMQEMNDDQALQLFSRHAFGEDSPPSDYENLSYKVVSLTGQLPLALEVIGSLLYQCEKKRWKAIIDRLKNVPNQNIQEKLELSFDALEFDQKQIFLDIACFFINEKISKALYMWEDCQFYPEDGIEVLVSMSLVKIGQGLFEMHDMVRDLGREIVRKKYFHDPSKRSRIWSSKDALEVLKIKQQEKPEIEGFFMEKSPADGILTNEQFSGFRNLRLLKLVGTKLAGDFVYLLPKLKLFTWHQCPSDFLATNLSLENLVVLDLSHSLITENWAGWTIIQMAKNLKSLDLTNCCTLSRTPDLSNNGALEELILRGCRTLTKIHSSIGKLTRLKRLDLEGCSSLRELPEQLGLLEDLEEILVEGSRGSAFHLPESIGNLCSLSTMKLQGIEITRIPESIGGLANLTCLLMNECTGITELPDTIGDLKSLVKLDLSCTGVNALPNSVGQLIKLKGLSLYSTNIEELPDSLGGLKSLEKLILGKSKLRILPDSIGELESLVGLYLGQTELRALTASVGQLIKLENLNLMSTKIEELPDSLGGLKSLVSLNLSESKLKILPNSIGDLESLEELHLDKTELGTLPDSFGQLVKLKWLNLKVSEDSSLQKPVCKRFSTQWIENLTDLKSLMLDCVGMKRIPRLPSSLERLVLQYVTTETELPDFSNLQKLETIVFRNCSLEYEQLEGLRELQWLMSLALYDCTEDLVKFSCTMEYLSVLDICNSTTGTLLDFCLLKNLSELSLQSCKELAEIHGLAELQKLVKLKLYNCSEELVKFSFQKQYWRAVEIFEFNAGTLLDVSRSKNLRSLSLVTCKELAEIHGLEELEFLGFIGISNCPSLVRVGNLSELKELEFLIIEDCSKLREIGGLDGVFLNYIRIKGCGSLRNTDELKIRCRKGYFDDVEYTNIYADD